MLEPVTPADRALAKQCQWFGEILPFHSNDSAAELLLHHLRDRFGRHIEWELQPDSEEGFWVILLDLHKEISFAASGETFALASCLAIKGFLAEYRLK